ncbi:hypothetical protein TEA_018104 [Camellia sinensis var. sinensis]|uniref:Uncharacterized protein n=1 Tax=Camellia sinensis var. sinensis TaxID=542762 RepID=A0A4S4DBT1_CAMSN|nr:hypothetical protein TEA_018104 [Camellia sinensis var. sinensis]
MIGDETAAGLPATILDASIAPSLTWQYDEGFLSSSTGSGNEPKSDSTESCESESGSSSIESESGNPGDDNPDATVMSRSFFSFSRVHPDARPYKTKTVLNFNDLCLIYGYTSADGRYSRSSHDVDVEDDIQGVNLGAHPDTRSYRVKTVPSYHKLCVIYGQDTSDGKYSRLARNVDPDCEVPLLMIGSFDPDSWILLGCGISIQEHTDAIAYKNKTLGYYNDLCILFGSKIADRGLSCQDMGTEIDYKALEIEMDQASGCIQIPLLDVDTSDRGKKRPTKMPSVSGRSRKVQKTGEEIQEPCIDTTSVVTRLVKKQEKSYDSIANAIDALQAISDIDDELLLDGCDLLEDERKAKTFLALDVNLRKKWLLRKLGR